MMTPCALCHLDFDIDLSDDDEVQVILLFDILMSDCHRNNNNNNNNSEITVITTVTADTRGMSSVLCQCLSTALQRGNAVAFQNT